MQVIKLGVGKSPVAFVDIRAGNATDAPFKLTSGTYLSAIQQGAFEYSGRKLWFTDSLYRQLLNEVLASTVAIPCVATWTASSGGTPTGRAMAWAPELKTLVAIDEGNFGNNVYICQNGISFTQNASVSAFLNSVCWSPELGLFCAVGSSGAVYTSSDGTTWNSQTAAESNTWKFVCWSSELTLFVAVASTGTHRVMTSSDGVTWNPQTAAEANTWVHVIWAPEASLFCAISTDGTHRVMTSSDGVTWNPQTASEANTWRWVSWSPQLGIFAAVSSDGTHRVMTSPDAVTWSNQTAAEANSWQAIAWSSQLNLFAAVASSGTHRIMTSPDGAAWTFRTDSAGASGIIWIRELGVFHDTAKYSQPIDWEQQYLNLLGRSTPQVLRGDIQMNNGRFSAVKGSTVTAANNLVLSSNGNIFQVSGTTQINLIDNTSWIEGSEVTLYFINISTVTVKHNQTASGNNKPIFLSGSADLSAKNFDRIKLQYLSINSVPGWYEISRVIS